ncbi:MAG: HAMP domain-containing histidine kinase [Hyphomonadaceae bacterium]|nr:MAG: Cache sensor hybrid histidine kinase [Caulobacteraceae bacterium]MBT9444408.1 HAMP domain-containing histidine kinase [Hyphomonadaceae bacterium]TPW05635.1 MAG: Cache sensor hybrid histidine kinase [Alphaproteobacteria bacterium]
MMAPVHRILERQLRKARDPSGKLDLRALLAAVHETYAEHDRDLRRIDRANRLMAEELEEMLAIRERAAAADAASAAKTRFLANMSHELRTPLSAIIGYSEIIAEENADTSASSVSADAGRILAAGRHLLRVISDVLDLTKIEADHIVVEIAPCDMRALVETALATVKPAAETGAVDLRCSYEGEIGVAHTDGFRVNQCLLNLLSNAVKFSPGGSVALAVRRRPADDRDTLEFEVRDTGIGMTPEQMEKAFKPFEQADASTTRRFGGTGLGLSIARGLARALGGDITATSAPGAGSTFTLSVPAPGATTVHARDKAA